MQSMNVVFWITGLILWSLIPISLVVAVGWYLFSAVCTIIFVFRIAKNSGFKNKHDKPISWKAYIEQFRYWQHCTGQSYHVTLTKTGEKIWMPWPYGTKKYKESVLKREESEWRALGGDDGTSE